MQNSAPIRVLVVEDNAPDVLLIDEALCEANLLSRLRSTPEWQKTPILVLTSSLSPWECEQAKSFCVSEYIRKPADLYEFLTSVGQAARRLLSRE